MPFSGPMVDRAADRRAQTGLIDELRALPSTRVLVVQRGHLAVEPDRTLVLLSSADLRGVPGPQELQTPDAPLWLFLGADDGKVTGRTGAFLALVLPDGSDDENVDIEGVAITSPLAQVAHERRWIGLREVIRRAPPWQSGLATIAVALAAWHLSRACPRCGGPTVVENAGWTRRCERQGTELFPRTDPAVIMAVVDRSGPDERLLLGHATHWPAKRFSTLAGYVEPGESAENAVRREVAEESGVVVGAVAYRGSQPWPFPGSLMLGFTAEAVATEVNVDGVEVTEARWFTRAELIAEVEAGGVVLPDRVSIARGLIEEWLGVALPDGDWTGRTS